MTALDPEKLKKEFEERGIVVIEQFLTRAQAEDMRREMSEIVEREGTDETDGKIRQEATSLGQIGVYSETFSNFARDPRLLDILEVLMGPNIELNHTKSVFKTADAPWGSPWHQDAVFWKGGTKITVGLVLSDSTLENGCLQVVPGSHREIKPHRDGRDFAKEVDPAIINPESVEDVVLEAGGIFILHDGLLHASRDNQTTETRWFFYATYASGSQPDLKYSHHGEEQQMVRGELTAPRLE